MPDAFTETAALIRQGDAALRAGSADAAQAIYMKALERSTEAHRAAVIARLGFVGRPKGLKLLDIQQKIEALGEYPVFVGDTIATWGKTNSFVLDGPFLKASHAYRGLLPYVNWQLNLNVVLWAVRQVHALEGDFVELGVFRGHTTLTIAETIGFKDWPRRWWLYDTFEGVPDDQLNEGWAEKNVTAYKGTFSHEEVKARFRAFPNIEVIKGRVPEILAEGAPDKIAFMHVDLNSAKAEIAGLEALYPRVVPGGVIVFDDYGWLSAFEQHVAIREWLAQRGQVVMELPTGQGVLVKPPA